MKLYKLWVLFVAVVMLLSACTPAELSSLATPTPEPGPPAAPTLPPAENSIQPPAAVSAAQQALAKKLGISSTDITINSIEEVKWSDSCLGLGGPAESCLQTITPGFKAAMTAGGKTYEAHTDQEGKQVRFVGDDPSKGAPQAAMENLPAVAAARSFLAGQVKTVANDIQLVSANEEMWPDSCLGVAKPEEMCLTVITPGYRVVFQSNGQLYEVHTDQDGSSVRMAGAPQALPEGGSKGSANQDAAVKAAKEMLAQQIGVKADQIQVVEVEAVAWPNGCMGVQMPGRMCTQMIVPGFRVVLEANGTQYEFHTDEIGGQVLPAIAALPQTANKLLVWEQTEGGACTHSEIGSEGIAYGKCGSTNLQQSSLAEVHATELAEMFVRYGVFKSETKTGSVSFNGQGSDQPDEAEMRAIAEWAKLVTMEAQGGRGGAAWGLAMAWHQEGGIAGVCSDLALYRSGYAQPTSCSPRVQGTLPPWRLRAEDLKKLYTWVDELASFEFNQQDPATADAMKTTLVFTGSGTKKATPAQQQEIAQFAQRMYLESTR